MGIAKKEQLGSGRERLVKPTLGRAMEQKAGKPARPVQRPKPRTLKK